VPPPPPVRVDEARAVQRLVRGEELELSVALDGHRVSRSFGVELSVGEVAWKLGQELDGGGLDLLGHQSHGWQFEGLEGTEKVAGLDPEAALTLRRVPGSVVRIDLEVKGERPFRFQAPVSTVVPARALVAHLVRWLGLRPDLPWHLWIDGDEVGGWELLADRSVGEGTPVVLR
jgi:hypothetical protein